jgi:hypothetical protein
MLVYMWAFTPNPPVQQLIIPVVEVESDGPLTICDIAIGITTTAQYQDRVDMQKKTWLKRMCNKKSNYRFITDDGNSTDINAIYSACPKDYHSVCCKTADLVHRLYELFPTKRWFMKCDDDSYVVPERIVEFLSNLNYSEPILTGLPYYIVTKNMCPHPQTRNNCTTGYKRPWIGGQFNYTKEDNLVYPAGGPCYAFSHELARRMVKYDFVSHHTKYCTSLAPFEDIMTSRIAGDVGGYFVSGSTYFYEDPAKKESIKKDKSCCYHMKKKWQKMEQVHEALYASEPNSTKCN